MQTFLHLLHLLDLSDLKSGAQKHGHRVNDSHHHNHSRAFHNENIHLHIPHLHPPSNPHDRHPVDQKNPPANFPGPLISIINLMLTSQMRSSRPLHNPPPHHPRTRKPRFRHRDTENCCTREYRHWRSQAKGFKVRFNASVRAGSVCCC